MSAIFSAISRLCAGSDEELMSRVQAHGDPQAFARGQMNVDDFRKTARIACYEVEAGANPWYGTFGGTGFGGTVFSSPK
jgi:hypothetical protein